MSSFPNNTRPLSGNFVLSCPQAKPFSSRRVGYTLLASWEASIVYMAILYAFHKLILLQFVILSLLQAISKPVFF